MLSINGGLLLFGCFLAGWLCPWSSGDLLQRFQKVEKIELFKNGTTKSGEKCRVVTAAGYDNSHPNLVSSSIKQFVALQKEQSCKIPTDGVKYDCFMNLDTQEFQLSYYKKTTNLRFSEEIINFVNRNSSNECYEYTYTRLCLQNEEGKLLGCQTTGKCVTTKDANLLSKIIISCSCVFIVLIVVILGLSLYNATISESLDYERDSDLDYDSDYDSDSDSDSGLSADEE